MSEKTYIDLGQATAYAYAKAHGYTGTEEEFGIEQAQFAQNAQQVAEDRVVVREDRTHVDNVVETFTETTAPEAVQRVTTEGNTQVARVQGVGDTAVQDVTDTKDQALQDVEDAGDSEISDIQSEGNTQVGLVRSEGTTQVSAVNQAGTTQVGLVQTEGTTQVQNVEDKGQEIIDALPPNYEEDMAQVEDFLENLVKVSDTQPSSEANKLWIEDQAEEEIEVPTYEEFESLSNDVSDALNAIDQKQDAPQTAGTAGQVLGLDSNLDPVWVDQTGGGGGMNIVNLSGTQITQVGADNTFYVCGELTELTFTAPAVGITMIRFTSGTTPTVCTINGVTKWMYDFDPTTDIEANLTYDINVLNGIGVAGWA